jgi:lipopolysaccharide transport system permease protein
VVRTPLVRSSDVSALVDRRSALPSRLAWVSTHRQLLSSLLRREVRQRYKGSALGILWSYLQPLLMAGIYSLIFSVLWRSHTTEHYPVFVLCGLAVWAFFQSAVMTGTTSIVDNSSLIKKIWFPREIVVVSAVLSHALAACVMFALVVPAGLYFTPSAIETVWILVPVFALFILLACGISLLLATANVYFRDVAHLVGVIFLPWYFLTPVLYSFSTLPGATRHPHLITLLRYGNPVAPYVEVIRGAVLDGTFPPLIEAIYVLVVGPAFFGLGLWVFQRREDTFAMEL